MSGVQDSSDVEVAIAAVVAGMAAIRSASDAGILRMQKGADDVVTSADLASEQAIRAVLSRLRPDDALLGEEYGGPDPSAHARTWLVDPLCGTRNFASGAGDYATNVALHNAQGQAVAAVGDVRRDVIHWTDGTRAATRENGTDTPIAPSSNEALIELNADEPEDAIGLQLLSGGLREWRAARISGTSLALAWVAAGRRAAYVADGDLRESVHFAAGIALCLGAGCVVTDLFGVSHATGRGLVIAADRDVHEALMTRIRRVQEHG